MSLIWDNLQKIHSNSLERLNNKQNHLGLDENLQIPKIIGETGSKYWFKISQQVNDRIII